MSQAAARVLLVEPDPAVADGMVSVLASQGIAAATAHAAEEAFEKANRSHFDVALVDPHLGGLEQRELLERLREIDPRTIVIVTSGYSTVQSATEAMRAGAFDYLPKPVRSEELILVVKRAFERAGESRPARPDPDETGFAGIVARSQPMLEVFETIRRVAGSSPRSTVLIEGESGTGKELVARAIHDLSKQRAFPFISVHCSAIPTELLESELFGHERGAFTGAVRTQKGKFELADRGTLLLDEVGTLDQRAQVDLLRVLQEREFTRIGGSEVIPLGARVIATTNEPLRDLARSGRMREDLYYRLNVVRIQLPPLRDRRDDLPLLAEYCLKRHAKDCERAVTGFTERAMRAIEGAYWRGNVRELDHAIERAVVVGHGRSIDLEDLPRECFESDASSECAFAAGEVDETNLCLADRLGALERQLIIQALEQSGYNRVRAASCLGITDRALRYKLKNHGIGAPRSTRAGDEAARRSHPAPEGPR